MKLGKKDTLYLSDGSTKNISDFAEYQYLVLYFYPKDNTPGCTTEALEFTELLKEFNKQNTVIIGVSPDSIESHEKFIEKHALKILLASDTEHTLAEKFGAWGEKKNYGKTYMGMIRSTYVIDIKTGEVVKSWRNVRAKGHAEKVCSVISKDNI